ncbi:nitrite reductase small subunit NirD [Paenibacillus apiarius]|uniref:Nitrite reductase small subunit NirD n=1 Tax=Paenibacillus apiarius TaxID=46240 RepID=A0ABT4DRL8_9BACL|nr:nitrite reductase small subunit NirD [Paenibacillus apiarius]MBN3522377.1 nitrite reductase small subunit NirD [Paenibacillus apiarius]MCY9514768.1 nitrite reductase small subunit NirD [Paenibacillus apiarius]MCY9518758.1 nitrite reductase small subunit NirD [Paenibacillus apiarius]MCY9552801.1 nitrite reductase small subunit NirD [Paenibacillus apiarius]MCY9556826.1 nitrite reductase small subunit NirD [Paenibacillus apiarius]
MSINREASWVAVGQLEDFIPRVGRVVLINGIEVAVFHTTEAVYAIENRSPHPKGGPLSEGIVSGYYLYDPLHDWKIDLRDGCVQAPDTGQARTFPVRLEEAAVYIAVA